ncbi:MAG: hypothetical protein RBS80_10185 [Thermoguttaceae bacterium]|jgi:Mrp family chromosome partitioning ATPase|nr:hypothetical protein [Thermoguttaceae bacterium]
MASLDKAFIKAYRQRESAVGAIPIDTSGTDSLVDALEDRPLREAKKRSAAARHDGVLAVLQSDRLQVQPQRSAAAQPPKPAAGEQDAVLENGNQAVPPFLHSRSARPCHAVAGRTATSPVLDAEPDRKARVDCVSQTAPGQVVPAPHINASSHGSAPLAGPAAGPAATAPDTATSTDHSDCSGLRGAMARESGATCPEAAGVGFSPSHTPADCTPAIASSGAAEFTDTAGQSQPSLGCGQGSSRCLPPDNKPGAAGSTEPAGEDACDARAFRPLLQVDRIAPSSVGRRLGQRAAAELDRLADSLMAIAHEGRQVIGFASDGPGQGTTTLLGVVALRLAERRVSAALVDASMADPQLATELGLLPDYGWEEALTRSVPCEELVIESASQPMALVPLCTRFDAAGLPDDFTPLREIFATLREHYDLVLVDLGAPDAALASRILKTLDTVLLVHDVRSTPAERVYDRHRTLSRAGVNIAGIVESFVSGG